MQLFPIETLERTFRRMQQLMQYYFDLKKADQNIRVAMTNAFVELLERIAGVRALGAAMKGARATVAVD